MICTIRGVKPSSGNYQGYDYSNFRLHCTSTDDGTMLAGDPVEIVTVKQVVCNAVCARYGITVSDLVGRQIRVFYNQFGKIEDFDILAFPSE